jgi:hypothetical protein
MHYGSFTTTAQNAEAKGEKRLAKRIRIEGRICAALTDAILAKGATISVNDGEEWVVKRSTDKGAIINALFSTDEDRIVARDAEGTLLGSWYLVYGNDGYDVISDYSANDFAEAIWEELRPVIDKAEEEMA